MTGEGWATAGVTRLGISVGSVNTVAILDEPGRGARPLLFDGSPLLPSAALGSDGLVAVFDGVAAEMRRMGGISAVETVVSCPLGWDPAERDALASAAMLAGLGRVDVVEEPLAAASLVTDTDCVLVVDVGAVTADVTLVRRTAGGLAVAAAETLADAAGDALDAGLTELIRSWVAASGGLPAWERLDRAETPDDEDASSKLMLQIVGAKEALSRQPSAALLVPLAEVGVTVPRVQFEAVATRVLEPVVRTVGAALAGAAEPVTVLLIGGTSRVPVFTQLVAAVAGPYAVIPPVPDPELVIAQGCAAWPGRAAPEFSAGPSLEPGRGDGGVAHREPDWAGRHSAPMPQIEPAVGSSGRHTRPDEGSPSGGPNTSVGRRRRDELEDSGVFRPGAGVGRRRAEPDDLDDSGVSRSGAVGGRRRAEPAGIEDSGVFRPGTGGGRRRADGLEDSGVFRSGAVNGHRGAEPARVDDSGVFRSGAVGGHRGPEPVRVEDSGVFRSAAAGGHRGAEPERVEDSGVFRSGAVGGYRSAGPEAAGEYQPEPAGRPRNAEPANDLELSGGFRAFSRPVSRRAENRTGPVGETGEAVPEEENRLMVAGLGLLLAGLAWFPVLVVAGGVGLARFVPGVVAALVGLVLLIAGSGRSKR
uniref:Hsp70 family protein n=1 Tax=Paractinoplanes polyasparticus TaxID=2856853 RepID=UPI001C84EAAA|nr:Hsp70 family protein [Actinoplanes polyasparticus]